MSNGRRLVAYGVALVATFAASMAVGAVAQPRDEPVAPAPHSTPHGHAVWSPT